MFGLGVLTVYTKGRLSLFNHFIDMRTTVSLSISCQKTVFLLILKKIADPSFTRKRVLLKFSNKNTFFLHEVDRLTVVLMSIK